MEKKEYVKYIEFMTKIFEWLYAFYDEWGEQYYSSLYLHYFWLEILNNYKDLDKVAKNSIINYVKKSVKNIVKFDRGGQLFEDYFMSYLIDEISKDNKFDDAFQIIKIRIDALILNSIILVGTEQDNLDKYLKSLSNLIQIGFELKDKNSTNIKTLLDKMKSDVLESRLSSLAINIGYVKPEDKEWYYKNDKILEFIKDKNTKTIEIDINQSKIEHQRGKERKVLFFSECKYKTKPATIRDIKFFYNKAIDFLEQQKDHARQYPKRLLPRYDELWFVCIKGFTDNARLLTHNIGRCKIKLVDGAALNKHLTLNNIRKIEII